MTIVVTADSNATTLRKSKALGGGGGREVKTLSPEEADHLFHGGTEPEPYTGQWIKKNAVWGRI